MSLKAKCDAKDIKIRSLKRARDALATEIVKLKQENEDLAEAKFLLELAAGD